MRIQLVRDESKEQTGRKRMAKMSMKICSMKRSRMNLMSSEKEAAEFERLTHPLVK